jgi:hypothetical protein
MSERDSDAYLACPDYAHRSPPKIKTEQPVQCEVPFPNPRIGAVYLAIEGEDQPRSMLGHCVGRICRYATDCDVHASGRGKIDMIETGAAQGDHPCAPSRQHLENSSIKHVIHEHTYRGLAARERGTLKRQSWLQVAKAMRCASSAIGFIKETAIISLGAEYRNVHLAVLPALPLLNAPTAICFRTGWPKVMRRPSQSRSAPVFARFGSRQASLREVT